MKPLKLPDHWKAVRLGEICDVRYGLGQPPELAPDGVPMIRATDIKNGEIVSGSVLRVRPEAIPRGKNPCLKAGDILVVRSGAYTGDVAMYDGRWQTAIAGYDLIASPADGRIEAAYLAACLLGETVQRYFRSQRDRAAQPHLNSDQLRNAIIPIPPLPEQRAIARALQAVRDAKEARRREAALERERKAALMQHLFTRGVRGEATKQTEIGEMPHDWRLMELKNLLRERLRNGHSAVATNSAAGVRTLTLTAVTKNDFSLDHTKLTTADPEKVKDLWLRSGDILIERANTLEFVGLTAIYHGPGDFAIYPDLMVRVRVNEMLVLPRFLAAFLLTDVCRRYFQRQAAHTAGNFPKIDHNTIENVLVPVPGLDEQKEIAAVLLACDAKIAAVEQETSLLAELFRALLEELMTGRLSALPLADSETAP